MRKHDHHNSISRSAMSLFGHCAEVEVKYYTHFESTKVEFSRISTSATLHSEMQQTLTTCIISCQEEFHESRIACPVLYVNDKFQ